MGSLIGWKPSHPICSQAECQSWPKVVKARAIKESLRELWEYSHVKSARDFFEKWDAWASHSRLEPVKKVAEIIITHVEYFKIAIYFNCGGLNLFPF